MMPALGTPSPARTVRIGVRVLRRAGYGRDEALTIIMDLCKWVTWHPPQHRPRDLGWISLVHEEARARSQESHLF